MVQKGGSNYINSEVINIDELYKAKIIIEDFKKLNAGGKNVDTEDNKK